MKYRKKPVVIEAIQFTGVNQEIIERLEKFTGFKIEVVDCKGTLCLVIPTLEGEHIASPYDWIIKGVKGEFYPCKPDIFKQTYEKVT